MSPSAVKKIRLIKVFKCQLCQTIVPPRIKATRIVVETRVKQYAYRAKANRLRFTSPSGHRATWFVDDPGGTGEEIVREVVACPACAQRH